MTSCSYYVVYALRGTDAVDVGATVRPERFYVKSSYGTLSGILHSFDVKKP